MGSPETTAFANFTFARDPTGRWFAELPAYPGPRADLEMVLGADSLLELVAQGQARVGLVVSRSAFIGSSGQLSRTRLGEAEGGAYYQAGLPLLGHALDVWLCDVLAWALGDFPETLYFLPFEV